MRKLAAEPKRNCLIRNCMPGLSALALSPLMSKQRHTRIRIARIRIEAKFITWHHMPRLATMAPNKCFVVRPIFDCTLSYNPRIQVGLHSYDFYLIVPVHPTLLFTSLRFLLIEYFDDFPIIERCDNHFNIDNRGNGLTAKASIANVDNIDVSPLALREGNGLTANCSIGNVYHLVCNPIALHDRQQRHDATQRSVGKGTSSQLRG